MVAALHPRATAQFMPASHRRRRRLPLITCELARAHLAWMRHLLRGRWLNRPRWFPRQVVKKTGAAMRNRIMAAPVVEVWRRRIEGLEREVAEVMREEREERALRKAEQEATKVGAR